MTTPDQPQSWNQQQQFDHPAAGGPAPSTPTVPGSPNWNPPTGTPSPAVTGAEYWSAPAAPPAPPTHTPGSGLRRRHLAGLAATVVVTAAVVGGGVAWGVTSLDGHAKPGTPAAGRAAHATHATKAAASKRPIVATITAENGSTWTVSSAAGKTYTVHVTPKTQFGNTKTPSVESALTAGTKVRITGKDSNGTITAERIAASAKTA